MIYDYKNGVYGIEAHYEWEGFVQVYLVVNGGEAALIETAHNGSVPYVLAAMEELGVSRDSVKYVCVTHVHLDHAGGAGAYMQEFPNATLVVHPRGARHMIDPTQLVAGVREVYGAKETERLYGTIIPVPAGRVLAAEDGTELPLGASKIKCIDAPGHAKHHMVFLDESSGALFAGDGFGISYKCMRGSKGQWAMPTASPVQFDPEAMKRTMRRILSFAPKAIYATHYGEIEKIAETEKSLEASVDEYVRIAVEAHGEREGIMARLIAFYREKIAENGQASEQDIIEKAMAIDLELDTQGLVCWYAHEHGQAK